MTTSYGSRPVGSISTLAAPRHSTGDAPPAVVPRAGQDGLDIDDLIDRFQRHGDRAALDTVMASFDWLALACARRLRRRGEAIEDLEQVAREGLLGAVARFDVNRGASFTSFAWVTVLGALRHYYRSRWQVRIPRALQEMHLASVNAVEELTAGGGRSPTIDELAAHVGVRRDEVLVALDVGHAYRVESLDHAPGDDGDDACHERVLGYVDEPLESAAERVDLRELLATLPPVQRTVLLMVFFDGRTQDEIGAHLGFSQVHVSRLMRAGLAGLRERAGAPSEHRHAS